MLLAGAGIAGLGRRLAAACSSRLLAAGCWLLAAGFWLLAALRHAQTQAHHIRRSELATDGGMQPVTRIRIGPIDDDESSGSQSGLGSAQRF